MPPRTAKGKATGMSKRKASKLAKELKLSPEEEDEIREAFDMFVDDEEEEAADSIPTTDVRKAMLALGFESSRAEMIEIIDTLDPENEGIVMWESFLRLCALKMNYRDEQAELQRAYRLFTDNTDGPITIADLRRIATQLKENVTDQQLEDMLLEASGGMEVNLSEFEGVMKRAGVL